MITPEQIENQNPNDVACLLVPMQGRILLLPSVSVAEMVPFTSVAPVQDSPRWLLGNYHWRERSLPLISFEEINGDRRPDLQSQCRVAVLNHTGLSEKLPFLAIMTQGIPRITRVSENEVQPLKDAEPRPYELMLASLDGEEVIIPNIAALEQAWLDLHL